jgi:hypothetical protein
LFPLSFAEASVLWVMVLPSLIFCLSVAVSVPFCQLKLSAAWTDTAARRQTASATSLSLIIFFLVP